MDQINRTPDSGFLSDEQKKLPYQYQAFENPDRGAIKRRIFSSLVRALKTAFWYCVGMFTGSHHRQ